jgi:hypothetical protein
LEEADKINDELHAQNDKYRQIEKDLRQKIIDHNQ